MMQIRIQKACSEKRKKIISQPRCGKAKKKMERTGGDLPSSLCVSSRVAATI